MTKSMKTLLIMIATIMLVAVMGVYIYVSTQLDTNEIRVIILQKIEKHFPNVRAEIGELDLEFGQSVQLKSNLLKFTTKDKKKLLEIKNISVKVPLFSIILGGGNIEIDLSNPNIYIDKTQGKSNWQKGLHENTAKSFIDFENPKELVIPAFLANSTFALRLHDSEISYRDGEKEQKTKISKFVLKNVGINSNAAFELKSDFSLPLENSDIVELHAFVVGSIGLSEYLNTNKLPIKTTYKVDGIKIKGQEEFFSMISGSFDAQVGKSGEVALKNSLRADKSYLKHSLVINKNEIRIDDLNGSLSLSELNPLFAYFKFPLDVKNGEFVIKGKLRSDKNGHYPEIEAQIKGMKGMLTDSEYSSDVELRFDQKSAEVKGQATLYGGSVTWESNLNYTLNDDADLDRRIKSLKTTIKMADLKLTSDSLRKVLLRKSREDKGDSNDILLPLFFVLPNSSVNAELINSKLDDRNISFEAKVKTNKGESRVKNLKLELGNGKLVVDGEAKLYEDGVNTKWKATLSNFSSGILSPFIGEDKPFLYGDFNGKIIGPFSIKKGDVIYDFKISLKSKKGKLLGINLNDEFMAIRKEIKEIPLIGGDVKIKDTKISNEYKNVVFEAVAKDGILNIQKTKYQSSDDALKIDTSGKVYLKTREKSLIEGKLYDTLGITSYLKNKFAMRSIPIALSGPGRDIQVDRDYTISKFTEHLKGKEGKKKVEKVIDDNVDKYIKGDSGKQIKKLLKGFLK